MKDIFQSDKLKSFPGKGSYTEHNLPISQLRQYTTILITTMLTMTMPTMTILITPLLTMTIIITLNMGSHCL